MAYEIATPFQVFNGTDGKPLNNGYIYVGSENLNPETNPIACYWDAALTLPVAQPIRTVSGMPSRNGTPAQIYAASPYSLVVRDSSLALVFSALNAATISYGSGQIANIAELRKATPSSSINITVNGYYTNGDGGGGEFRGVTGAAAGTYVDNGGTIIVPTGGDGSAAWLRVYSGAVLSDWFGIDKTGVINESSKFQSAIDFVSSAKVGILHVTAGNYLANVTIKSEVYLVGDGRNKTIITGATNAPVVKSQTTASTVRIGIKDLTIIGNAGTNGDGIALQSTAASTWVDTIQIENIQILNCGRYGLYVYGTSSASPFVQRLYASHVDISGCQKEGVYFDGDVYETTFRSVWATQNGKDGASPNVTIGSKTLAGHGPYRLTWIGGGLNHPTSVAGSRVVSDAAITTGTNILTSAVAAFSSSDVGKSVVVAGGNGGLYPLIANISAVTSSTQVTLSANATATVSGASAIVGTSLLPCVKILASSQINFIGVDLEAASVFFEVTGSLQRNLTVTGCNMSSTYGVLAAFWNNNTGGWGLVSENNSYGSNAGMFYGYLSSTPVGAALGVAQQIKDVNFKSYYSGDFVVAESLIFDFQAISANSLKLYQPEIGYIRCGGGSLNNVFDYAGATKKLRHGQKVTIFANSATTASHGVGNLYNKSGADVSVGSGVTISYQWDSLNGKWYEI